MVWMFAGAALAGSLDVGLGVGHAQVNDVHQTPLPYWAVGPRLDAGVSATPGRSRLYGRLEGQFGNSQSVSDLSVGSASWSDAAVELGADVAVHRTDRTQLYVGGMVSKRLELIDGMALHVWGLGTGALGARARLQHRVGRVRIAGELAIPLVATISRHNWSLDPIVPGRGNVAAFYTVGTRLEPVGRFLDLRARGSLALPLGKNHLWAVRAGLRYFGYPDPEPVRRLALDLSTGPSFTLGGRR